jgi:hypothetical protein
MADVNMNAAQEVGQVPLNVQAYIRSLEAQVTAAQAGQNMGQQRVNHPNLPGLMVQWAQIPQYGCSYSSNMPSYPM